MIDLAAYVLEPLHQEGAYRRSRGQPQDRRAGRVPAVLVVAPLGDHPTLTRVGFFISTNFSTT
jgi:hypothetical protein